MSRSVDDLTERVFNDLTVKRYLRSLPHHGAVWMCECKCGKLREVMAAHLKRGHVKRCRSCGRAVRRPQEPKKVPVFIRRFSVGEELSENAIERNRIKREHEEKIAKSLQSQPEREIDRSCESVFGNISLNFLRVGNRKFQWSCPRGVSSVG